MSRFKPGDQVVCTASGNDWFKAININSMSFWDRLKTLYKGNKTYGPGKNDLVTIHSVRDDDGFLCLNEYRNNGYYDHRYFQPLITDSQLEEELNTIEKSKTIELV